MRIAIPSKGRPEFTSRNVFKNPLVFVEPQEVEAYTKANPTLEIINIGESGRGISFVRNFIINYMDNEIYGVSDDDILSIYEDVKGKFVKLTDDARMLEDVESMMSALKMTALGFPPKAYAWCQTKLIKRDGKILNIIFFNGKLLKPIKYDNNLRGFVDVDMGLQIIRSGRISYTYNKYTYENIPYGEQAGGIGERKLDEMLKRVDYLNEKWGFGTVKPVINKKEKGERIALRIKWKG